MNNNSVPFLIPVNQDEFWERVRQTIREEIERANKEKATATTVFETAGLTYKPLYKIAELCKILHVTKPSIYEWIKLGILKPYKIRSRVYFLHNDIQELLNGGTTKAAK